MTDGLGVDVASRSVGITRPTSRCRVDVVVPRAVSLPMSAFTVLPSNWTCRTCGSRTSTSRWSGEHRHPRHAAEDGRLSSNSTRTFSSVLVQAQKRSWMPTTCLPTLRRPRRSGGAYRLTVRPSGGRRCRTSVVDDPLLDCQGRFARRGVDRTIVDGLAALDARPEVRRCLEHRGVGGDTDRSGGRRRHGHAGGSGSATAPASYRD